MDTIWSTIVKEVGENIVGGLVVAAVTAGIRAIASYNGPAAPSVAAASPGRDVVTPAIGGPGWLKLAMLIPVFTLLGMLAGSLPIWLAGNCSPINALAWRLLLLGYAAAFVWINFRTAIRVEARQSRSFLFTGYLVLALSVSAFAPFVPVMIAFGVLSKLPDFGALGNDSICGLALRDFIISGAASALTPVVGLVFVRFVNADVDVGAI